MPTNASVFNGSYPFAEAYSQSYDFNKRQKSEWTPETLRVSMETYASEYWKGEPPALDISFVNLFIDAFIGEPRQPKPLPDPTSTSQSTSNGKPTKRKEASPAAQRCKATVGFSLDYPNITPNAIPILFTISRPAMHLYILFCGYMNTFIGETKPRSRKAWAKFANVESKRTWQRLEKELIDNGLVKRHKDDKQGDYNREQEIKFVLPMAKAYRKMSLSDKI